MDITSVPVFKRPQSSGPKDKMVAQGELGPVYETVTGVQYTIGVAPDQRTTRAKVVEGTQEFLRDPPPAKEVAKAVGTVISQIPTETYKTLSSVVKGEGTLGDVYGMAAETGLGSTAFKVPEGATRMFGGRSARLTPELSSRKERAMKMSEDGVDPQTIWEDTGWEFDADEKMWQFEIDSSSFDIEVSPRYSEKRLFRKDLTASEALEAALENLSKNGEVVLRLDELLVADDLFAKYPELKDFSVAFFRPEPGSGLQGSFDIQGKRITVNRDLYLNHVNGEVGEGGSLMGTLVHESQHYIQSLEGTSRGSSASWLAMALPTTALQELHTKRIIARSKGDVLQEELARTSLEREAFSLYEMNRGEIEARAADLRRYLTSLEKKSVRPSETKKAAQRLMSRDRFPNVELP